jgi:inorganic pyrophosphatase
VPAAFVSATVCVVEVPKGSRNKYEYDERLGGIRFDRFLAAPVVFPGDYGFVRGTLGEDGDPLDVLICVSEPTFPGCIVEVKAVALLKMEDEHGRDDTIVGVPCSDPGWNEIEELEDLPDQLRGEITEFFSIDKDLDPERCSRTLGWERRAAAGKAIDEARRRYQQHLSKQTEGSKRQ